MLFIITTRNNAFLGLLTLHIKCQLTMQDKLWDTYDYANNHTHLHRSKRRSQVSGLPHWVIITPNVTYTNHRHRLRRVLTTTFNKRGVISIAGHNCDSLFNARPLGKLFSSLINIKIVRPIYFIKNTKNINQAACNTVVVSNKGE